MWVNAAETWVDVGKNKDEKKVLSHWISETGYLDVYILLGPSPTDLFRQVFVYEQNSLFLSFNSNKTIKNNHRFPLCLDLWSFLLSFLSLIINAVGITRMKKMSNLCVILFLDYIVYCCESYYPSAACSLSLFFFLCAVRFL